jgi:hypothetical protein
MNMFPDSIQPQLGPEFVTNLREMCSLALAEHGSEISKECFDALTTLLITGRLVPSSEEAQVIAESSTRHLSGSAAWVGRLWEALFQLSMSADEIRYGDPHYARGDWNARAAKNLKEAVYLRNYCHELTP